MKGKGAIVFGTLLTLRRVIENRSMVRTLFE